MNKSLLWCFLVLFSVKLFSSNSGLTESIEGLDIPSMYKDCIKDTLFFDGIDIDTGVSQAEKQHFEKIKKSRYDVTRAKINTLRYMIWEINYSGLDLETQIKNNKTAIRFLFNHCNDLEGLTTTIVAALTCFDLLVDLDDSTVDIKSMVFPEDKAEVFNGEFGDCIPDSLKK